MCHCQELGQLAVLASDWLFTLVQSIRSQLADLASDWLFTLVQSIRSQLELVDPTLDNVTTTHKFPSLVMRRRSRKLGDPLRRAMEGEREEDRDRDVEEYEREREL